MVSLGGKGIVGHLDRKDFQIRAQGEQPYADFRQQPSDIAAAFSVHFYCCSIKV